MIRKIDPIIKIARGSQEVANDFGGVHSLPAAYIFDGQGRKIFQLGGDRGPNGRHYLNIRQLNRAIDSIR